MKFKVSILDLRAEGATDPFEWHTIKQEALPAERQKVIDRHLQESEKLRASLQTTNNGPGLDDQSIPERMEESLRALGYLN